LPLGVLHAIALVWGGLLYRIPNRARNTTFRNLQACFPRKSEEDIRVLARASLKNTACTALEMGKAWLLPVGKTLALVTETEGLDELKQALDSGEGVILLAPHQGNWEIFGIFICDHMPATFLYQPPKIPAFDRLLKKARSRNGMSLAPTNRKGVAQLLKALQQGELAGILPDQVPSTEGGIYAPFFGESAFTMTLISKLIQRRRVKVFCGFAQRLPGAKGFKAIVKVAHEDIYAADLQTSVRGLNRTVEHSVGLAVTQYQWEYKRFRRRADGEKFYQGASD
jgi:KDO2-lipid IV(A) lauroyltransferase|tara:strand:+ start:29935 stop:30780 length:846 start_codon:yes stop_codon:yes gene_type:complete